MVYYSRLHTSPMLVRMQVGIRYERGQDILASRNWTMSRAEQQVTEVQSQQRSHSHAVRENRIFSQRAFVQARFRAIAQDYGARAYPSGLNREYHLRASTCIRSVNIHYYYVICKVKIIWRVSCWLCPILASSSRYGICAFYAIRFLASARFEADLYFLLSNFNNVLPGKIGLCTLRGLRTLPRCPCSSGLFFLRSDFWNDLCRDVEPSYCTRH
jgi:hypothetical protein